MTGATPAPDKETGRSYQRADFIDPAALMAMQSLELRARTVVEGFMTGLHRSPYHGYSAEFTEYRQYSPGDDPRHLDWKVFARSDRYFIRKFEDETNLRCHFIIDQSRSMEYGSLAWSKAQYAATLAATLSLFLFRQGDAIGLLTFDQAVRDWLPAKHRTSHLRQLMQALERPAHGTSTDLVAPLKRLVELIRRRGLLILISDFLAPLDLLESALCHIAAYGHEIMLFQVLDPQEINFNFAEPLLFEDAESATQQPIDPAQLRQSYLEKLDRHQATLLALCNKLGAGFQRLSTADPLEKSLTAYLQDRLRRGRTIQRARA